MCSATSPFPPLSSALRCSHPICPCSATDTPCSYCAASHATVNVTLLPLPGTPSYPQWPCVALSVLPPTWRSRAVGSVPRLPSSPASFCHKPFLRNEPGAGARQQKQLGLSLRFNLQLPGTHGGTSALTSCITISAGSVPLSSSTRHSCAACAGSTSLSHACPRAPLPAPLAGPMRERCRSTGACALLRKPRAVCDLSTEMFLCECET